MRRRLPGRGGWLALAALVLAAPAGAAEKLSFATVNWAPYYHADLPDNGFVAELTRQAYARQGYAFAVDFMAFPKALSRARKGQYDGVLGGWYTRQRAFKFAYTEPIVQTKNVLVARPGLDRKRYSSLKDLQGLEIGVTEGWAYTRAFAEADFLDKTTLPNQIKTIRLVLAGKLDLAAVEQRVFRYELRRRESFERGGATVLSPALSRTPIYNMIPKDHPQRPALVDAFNKGLAALKAEGTFDAIVSRLDQDV